MTTVSLQNNQLSNNRLEVFKSQINIQKYSLTLPSGENFIIPIRADGMINATALCKAGGKRLDNYMRSSKEFIETLKNSFTQFEGMELITSKIGGNHSGTWVHRKIGYHLAQWISPIFSVQVSNWLDELLLFGKVELGQENSNKELELKFQEQIKLLTQEKDLVSQQLLTVTRNHQNILKRRKRDLYEIGNVVYIISNEATNHFHQDNYHKSSFKDSYLSIK